MQVAVAVEFTFQEQSELAQQAAVMEELQLMELLLLQTLVQAAEAEDIQEPQKLVEMAVRELSFFVIQILTLI
jgi:hypothetical protein